MAEKGKGVGRAAVDTARSAVPKSTKGKVIAGGAGAGGAVAVGNTIQQTGGSVSSVSSPASSTTSPGLIAGIIELFMANPLVLVLSLVCLVLAFSVVFGDD